MTDSLPPIPGDEAPEDLGPEDLAGEFVLGVLDADQWRVASARLSADAGFAAEVERWEDRLAPLSTALESQALSRDLWPDIRRALPANDAGAPNANLTLWRGLTAASGFIAVASLAVALIAGRPAPSPTAPQPTQLAQAPAPAPEPMQVALLKPVSGAAAAPTAFVATLDRSRRMMTVSPGAAPAHKGKDLELWMIPPGGKPQALGVIPSDHSASMPMPAAFEGKGDTPIVLAVSVEPLGGSRTGQPTGPVVARGRFAVV